MVPLTGWENIGFKRLGNCLRSPSEAQSQGSRGSEPSDPPRERARRARERGPARSWSFCAERVQRRRPAGAVITSPQQESFSGARPPASSDVLSPAGVGAEERGANGLGLQRGEAHPVPPLLAIARLFPDRPRSVSQPRLRGAFSSRGPHPQLRRTPQRSWGLPAGAAHEGC